ncbi:MAG: trypsin-like serine protease [Chloroflexi bacterium]|nr:trypsin-like serine protease [Chloroflexota bacterium]
MKVAFRMLVIFVLALGSLTGCAGALSSLTTSSNSSSNAPAAPAAPEAPAAPASSDKPPVADNELPVANPKEEVNAGKIALNDVIDATVRIGVLDAAWEEAGHGSGSIIDSRGLILTNFHVIGDNETNQYYNADGISYIYVTLDPRDPPKLQFIAQVVDADAGRDLAVLRIIATTNGEPPADCLSLPTVTINMEQQVEIGQKLTSVGYSGVGGETVSIASGQVVGFEEVSMSSSSSRTFEAIKYDASDSRGSSGGPVINEDNEQVAVVFAGMSDNADSLGYARPVTLAEDLIASAKLVRIPGCNGAEAAKLVGPQEAQASSNENTNTSNSGGNQAEPQLFDISGYVYDRNTNQPIANASIVILKPGFSWDSIDYDRFADYIWTSAQTDANGVYVLSVTEEMVSTKTGVGFYADGYRAYLSDDILMIEFYDKDADKWVDLSFEPQE